MASRSVIAAVLFAVLGITPLWVGSAHAALGGDAASVLTDAAELHGAVNTEIRQQYDIQEISAEAGMRVREYLGRDGVVFAVSWSGPVMPDLQRLLGTHFAEYSAALKVLTRPGLQRSVRTASSELIVESGGHLRAYSGRAYLPALIPGGISAAEIF
jgi:hypothetical protein